MKSDLYQCCPDCSQSSCASICLPMKGYHYGCGNCSCCKARGKEHEAYVKTLTVDVLTKHLQTHAGQTRPEICKALGMSEQTFDSRWKKSAGMLRRSKVHGKYKYYAKVIHKPALEKSIDPVLLHKCIDWLGEWLIGKTRSFAEAYEIGHAYGFSRDIVYRAAQDLKVGRTGTTRFDPSNLMWATWGEPPVSAERDEDDESPYWWNAWRSA